jgi:O-antigen/teichoic acid export membrane protein
LLAPDLISVFASGPHWHEAVPIFRALLPFVLIRGINGSMGSMVVAAGRPRVLTMVSGSQLLLMIPAAYIGLKIAGFVGLTLSITVLNAGAMIFLVLLAPSFIDAPRRHLLLLIAAPALPAVVAALVGGAMAELSTSPPLRLALGAVSALSTYAALWELVCRIEGLSRLGAYPLSTLWKSLRRRSEAKASS